MAVRIRALDCTLVGKHMCSREGVLGSNPTTPKFLPNVFVASWRLLRNALSKGHHSRYITLFSEGTYSVIGFYELMTVFLVVLMPPQHKGGVLKRVVQCPQKRLTSIKDIMQETTFLS